MTKLEVAVQEALEQIHDARKFGNLVDMLVSTEKGGDCFEGAPDDDVVEITFWISGSRKVKNFCKKRSA